MMRQPKAQFVGLCTLDILYLVDAPPAVNEKIVARRQEVFAGGPATNAAVAFAALGGAAGLQAAVGTHAATSIMRDDLQRHGVMLNDLAAGFDDAPSISSVLICAETGERSVVSANATRLPCSADGLDRSAIAASQLLLVDGHNLPAAIEAARLARAHGVVTVLDGGSWKPGLEALVEWIDIAICSENFRSPVELNVPRVAVTHGPKPIAMLDRGQSGEIEVPAVRAVDTLGAGDIFHGAFCHAFLTGGDFSAALAAAARVAARSTTAFGTRAWIAEV
jgi:sugar/nucleoside kinase (ribokinase family)